MIKPTIICIIGASGSGKTTASMLLQKQFGWNTIVSYTTRPMRKNEINGIDHWFVAPNKVPNKKEMCAYTKFGGYEYWTTWGQFSMWLPNVYVIDEKGLMDLQNKTANTFKLLTVKIKRNDLDTINQKRKDRDKERIYIPDEAYNYIVDNNGSMEYFKTTLYNIAQYITENNKL